MAGVTGFKKILATKIRNKGSSKGKSRPHGKEEETTMIPRTPLLERLCDQIKHMKVGRRATDQLTDGVEGRGHLWSILSLSLSSY